MYELVGRAACQAVNEVANIVLRRDWMSNGIEGGMGFKMGSDVLSPYFWNFFWRTRISDFTSSIETWAKWSFAWARTSAAFIARRRSLSGTIMSLVRVIGRFQHCN